MLFSGDEIASILPQLGITHVVWIPDTSLGTWESALEESPDFELLRVCREGEAWPLAAGLILGGKTPILMMQTTGLFESGDALRNIVFDLKIPVIALIGARSWLNANSEDTAKTFAEPIMKAWNVKSSPQRTTNPSWLSGCNIAWRRKYRESFCWRSDRL